MPVQPGGATWRRQRRRRQVPVYRSEQPYITGIAGGPLGYFTDQYGNPRLVMGDAVWALPGNAGRWNGGNWKADFDQFTAIRAAQGFTVLYGKPMGTTQSSNIDDNGGTFDALFPFQGGAPTTGTAAANPSTGLTEPYWKRIDYFLDAAKSCGITIFLNAVGYASDFEGGPGPLAGKSTSEFTSYGSQLGTRYKSQPNIVWVLADDYFGGDDALLDAFLSGARSAGDTHVVTVENLPESGSRNTFDAPPTVLPWGTKNGQFNFVYSYNQEYYGVEQAYAESYPVPVIKGDGYFYQGNSSYSGGTGSFAWDSAYRQSVWWALASGARGVVNGSESIWTYQSTALAASVTDWWYANNAKSIRAVVEGLPGWQNLFPDLTSKFVTGGRGTRASSFASGGGGGQYEVAFTSSYVAASITPDGSLALLYLPQATTVTVNTALLGQGFTATWVDPVNGATSSAGTGTTYNSTAKGNNSQGDADWVLVFQGPSVNSPVFPQPGSKGWRQRHFRKQALTADPQPASGGSTTQGTAALDGQGTLTASPQFQGAAALSGTGTLSASQLGSAALSGTGTLSASPQFQGSASLAGTGTLSAAPAFQGAATLTGSGTLSAVPQFAGSAALAGSGTLSATSRFEGSAALTGTGSLLLALGISTILAGSGTLSAAPAFGGAATLTGSGTLSASSQFQGSAALSGSGMLSASPQLAGSAALSGSGTLSAAPQFAGSASLAGSGSLFLALGLAATLSGSGTITAIAGGFPGSSHMDGSGTLSASPQFQGAATLTGSGTLSAAPAFQGAAALSGAGTLSASSQLQRSAALDGSGTLTASLQFQGAAALSGSGSLTASPQLPAAASLSGAGTLSVLAVLAGSAAMSGSGTLATSTALAAAVAMSGAGTLTAAESLALVTSLSGSGTLGASPGSSGQGAASLSGSGTLSVHATSSGAFLASVAASDSLAFSTGASDDLAFSTGASDDLACSVIASDWQP